MNQTINIDFAKQITPIVAILAARIARLEVLQEGVDGLTEEEIRKRQETRAMEILRSINEEIQAAGPIVTRG